MPEEQGKDISVRVALRCRPLISKEVSEGCQQCVKFTPGEPQVVLGKDKAFTFDYVMRPEDPQEVVYQKSVENLVDGLFKGRKRDRLYDLRMSFGWRLTFESQIF